MLPLCRAEGIGIIPWGPLARGRLARAWQAPSSTDRVRYDTTATRLYSQTEEADKMIVDAVGAVAEARNLSRAQVALAWLMQQPGITAPIVGVTKPHHLDDAMAALTVKLEPEDTHALERHYVPHAANFFQ